jgi:hypothetical protein
VVAVNFGSERLSGNSPDSGRAFFHGDGLGDAVKGERNFCSRCILIGEGDAAVGVDLGGSETRRNLGGERNRRGECKEQREFAWCAESEEIHMRQFS